MKACVYTLGCKLNQYESFAVMNSLMEAGYDVEEGLKFADLYVINTCAVTAEAERKSRQVLSKIDKLNPQAKVVVLGCASQKSPGQFEKKRSNLLIMGSFRKGRVLEFLRESGVMLAEAPAEYEDDLYPCKPRTREYIKVQDGCNNFCSYCIVPYLRGRSRSRSPESILAEIERFQTDCREFVLTGINLSDYGRNLGLTLTDLVRSCRDVAQRIRFGSLEVNVITDEFLVACQELQSFCPHFHLSLQSGADAVLKAMNRRYTRAEYAAAAERIRKYFPDAAITTDVICGFPSESETDFQDSLSLCEAVAFSDIHVFPYSPREGTAAYSLGALPKETVLDRVGRLTALKRKLHAAYLERFIGKPLKVLTEEQEGKFVVGYSENYIKCYLDRSPLNRVVEAIPIGIYGDGVRADPME